MALNISHQNINPNVDAYALAYRAEMNRRKPWIDMMDKLAKLTGDVGASIVNYEGEKTGSDPNVEVEEGDAQFVMNGFNPFLYRRMMAKKIDKPDNVGLINPFTRKEW